MTAFEVNLRQLFSPKAIAESVQHQPPIKSPVMDDIYADRRNWPMPTIARSEISQTIGNEPVVRRGAPSINVGDTDMSIDHIEPQPVELSTNLGAAELNNLKLLRQQSLQSWRDNKVSDLRKRTRATSEAMSAQSLSGKIQYPMRIEGGYTYYEVDFGSVLSYSPSAKWDLSDTGLEQVLMDLVQMSTNINQQSGYGSKLRIYCGATAFTTLAGKVLAIASETGRFAAQVTENAVQVAGFRLELLNTSYRDHKAGTTNKSIADKDIAMVGTDAPFRFYYLSLDDLDADLQGMPFYVKPVKQDDPSGYKLIGKSKPLPVPVPKAICKATVIS
jgi:hypothetical protein